MRIEPNPARRASVAIFARDLAGTGVARNALALVDALGREHDVTLVAGTGGPMADGADATILDAPLAANAAEIARMIGGLQRMLRQLRPDVAISVGNRGHLPLLAASTGLHGTRRIYRLSNDISQRDGGRRRRGLAKLANDAQLALVLRDAARVVPVSAHLLAEPPIARALAAGRATVIENGVDIERVRSLAAEPCPRAPGAAPFVLGIGRLVAQKNFEILVEAVALANLVRPLDLVILGDGDPAPLRALAEQRGIGGRVTLAGYDANPFRWLGAAAVFALPSWREGAANVLLEALACQTNVVASPTAGNARAVLEDGRYGMLADPGDAPAWAAALLRQAGPDAVLPGERATAYGLGATLDAWAALVAETLAEPSSPSR